MRIVIGYESMYGNTRQIGEAIAEALTEALPPDTDVSLSALAGTEAALAAGADLLVIGGPTHVHGLSRPQTRASAVHEAESKHLSVDLSAPGPGLREWVSTAELPPELRWVAAFDTRTTGPVALTGRAAPKIAKLLRRRGLDLVCEPESFLVSRGGHLVEGEVERARAWAAELARLLAAVAAQ